MTYISNSPMLGEHPKIKYWPDQHSGMDDVPAGHRVELCESTADGRIRGDDDTSGVQVE